MKTTKILAMSVAILLVILGVLWISGLGGRLLFWSFIKINEPAGEFDPKEAVDEPDYSLPINWAALPNKEDPSDLVPNGISASPQGRYPVDVFFIHATGFLTSSSWTSPMDQDSGTEENTEFMMANMASAYNGCCNVYAPRYREANFFVYMGDSRRRSQVLDFAYQDVRRAFDHFIRFENKGRPFILAGHSQGTHHAMKLLKEIIDPSDLKDRMVAAYTIGATIIPLSPDWFGTMKNIKPCESANDLHCVVHWDTMPEGAKPMQRGEQSLCTNPLTWEVNEELASHTLNKGAVPPEGTYNARTGSKPDVRSNDDFKELGSPIPNFVSAHCRDGSLFVPKQGEGPFSDIAKVMPFSYHLLDYALFYMDIHENAKLRVSTYLEKFGAPILEQTQLKSPEKNL